MKLTEHFALEEMTVSEYASRNGMKNIPSEKSKENLKILCTKVLEPLRLIVKKPVVVISGYRSQKLNAAVGGAENSQHTKGQAADIIIPGMTIDAVFKICDEQLEFDQLIKEFGQWVHISYSAKPRNQKLLAQHVGGKTKYIAIA